LHIPECGARQTYAVKALTISNNMFYMSGSFDCWRIKTEYVRGVSDEEFTEREELKVGGGVYENAKGHRLYVT
jgi:hypothetical protein